MLGIDEIKRRFGFHPGTNVGEDATVPQHEKVREVFKYVGRFLDECLPEGREKKIAIERLEDCAMWSNKSVAMQAPLSDGNTTALVVVIENGTPIIVGDAKINEDHSKVEVKLFTSADSSFWGKECIVVDVHGESL